MKTNYYRALTFGTLFFVLLFSSCKNETDTIEVELSLSEPSSLQERRVSGVLSFKSGDNDIRQLTPEHLNAYYVKIVGLKAHTKWNEPEIIEQYNEIDDITSFFVRTSSKDHSITIATTVHKVGGNFLLINDPDEPIKTCSCTSSRN